MKRMKKIEGQARGIQRMIDEDRYCIDIVQQLSALSAASDEVSLLLLQSHIEGCVTDAIREKHGEGHIKELMETIRKAMKRWQWLFQILSREWMRCYLVEDNGWRDLEKTVKIIMKDGKEEIEMAIDPVCDMEVDEKTASATSEYKGRTYYFCAPGCKKAFDENPAKYAKE
jgi:DNA-binding FrmR family transcriptional regulator/YHS domain-containing protein